MTSEDLAARVRRLELIELAKAATVSYARACDRKDVDALRSGVFTADAVLRLPRERIANGIDEVVDFYTTAFAREPGTRRHFLTNQVASVEAGADGAERVRVDSYFFFLSADALSVIGWGAYHDVVVASADGPRIADKTIAVDVHTDLHTGWAMPPLQEGLT
jgi:hypothetical protein